MVSDAMICLASKSVHMAFSSGTPMVGKRFNCLKVFSENQHIVTKNVLTSEVTSVMQLEENVEMVQTYDNQVYVVRKISVGNTHLNYGIILDQKPSVGETLDCFKLNIAGEEDNEKITMESLETAKVTEVTQMGTSYWIKTADQEIYLFIQA